MWKLEMSGGSGTWKHLANFETFTAAARKIIELEDLPVSGVFFQILIETDTETENEAFDHLEYTAPRTGRLYVVKRIRH